MVCVLKKDWISTERGKDHVIIVTRAIYMLYLARQFSEYSRLPERSAGSSLNLTQYEISIRTTKSNFLMRVNRNGRLKNVGR